MRWLFLLLLTACDFEHFALMNSIPVRGQNPPDTVHVFLGVDGLSYYAVQELQPELDPSWHVSKMVSMFPSTSDCSWGRLLRTKKIDSYEYQYYNPQTDTLEHTGYSGIIAHAMPPIDGSFLDPPAYIFSFDYFGNGYLDTLWKYRISDQSFGESLDNFFFLLGGRSQVNDTFTGYFLEVDATGHMKDREQTLRMIRMINKRIVEFKRKHKDRNFEFTVFSDHGMDFISANEDELLKFDKVLKQLGIKPVSSFAEGRASGQLFAIPIIHTRVSYLALHTLPEMRLNVAEKVSSSNTVDLVFVPDAADTTVDPTDAWEWYSVWRNGVKLLHFAFIRSDDSYFLPKNADYQALGLNVTFSDTQTSRTLTDEEAFIASIDSNYPDFLFRIRTGFEALSIRYPADVLISFKRPYASLGFEIPFGANAIASAGFHGAIDELSSAGVVLTQQGALPAIVRSDDFLKFFPSFEQHLEKQKIKVEPQDSTLTLDYSKIFP